MAAVKTNAMRILEQGGIDYNIITYDTSDGRIDGVSVAEKIGRDPVMVYKTLVAQGHSKNLYVFIVPVQEELDLKKAAVAAGEKNVEMIAVKDILKWTGYIRGGCSPIGMKKNYKTFIDESAESLEKVVVSAGKIGVQIEVAPEKLCEITKAEYKDIVR